MDSKHPLLFELHITTTELKTIYAWRYLRATKWHIRAAIAATTLATLIGLCLAIGWNTSICVGLCIWTLFLAAEIIYPIVPATDFAKHQIEEYQYEPRCHNPSDTGIRPDQEPDKILDSHYNDLEP